MTSGLTENGSPADPMQLFRQWRAHAYELVEYQPDAMALSTVMDGQPSTRFVMLRAADERGLVFYTNYTSRKSLGLAENPRASVALYWPKCERQVRAEGVVERISEEESDAYFETRPRESQIEAWASPQSRVIDGRGWLESRWRRHETEFPDRVPRPEWWGGFRMRPSAVEFWQQGAHRMHDRLLYRKRDDGSWSLDWLAP